MHGRIERGRTAGRRTRRVGLALAAALLAAASACTSGDIRPAVDVGMQTSAVPPPAVRDRLAGRTETYQSPHPDIQRDIQPLSAEEEAGVASAPGSDAGDVEQAPSIAMRSEPPEAETRTEMPPAAGIEMAGFPRMDDPVPRSAALSGDEVSCRSQLRKLRVAYTELPPIHEGACGIDHPIKVTRIGNVAIKPAATLNCQMTEALAAWTRDELVPASRWRFFSGVKALHQGSSYSCRNIAGTSTPSEHTHGNAIDIMKIELNSGRMIDVRKPGLFAFRKRGLLNTVRADGCEYFTTVLGPGYNADHADHFHFDIKARRSGHRACR